MKGHNKKKELFMKFKCNWCKGKTRISVEERGDKGTVPEIEHCPLCGMSDEMIKSAGVENG